MVGPRQPADDLYTALEQRIEKIPALLAGTLSRIGDCLAPAIIAAAVYAGHRYAQELEEQVDADNPIRHDRVFSVD